MPRTFKIDMETRFGPLRGFLPISDAPIRLAEFAHQLFPLSERITQQAVDAVISDGETKISCGPDCGACCRQAVPLSIPEVFFLRDLLLSFPPERRGEILGRFESMRKNLSEANLELELLAGETQDQRWMRFGSRYFSLGLDCPFLENESCSIHPVRPTVCRDFLVTSPPEECADITSEKMVCIDNVFSLPHCLARLTGILMDEEPQLIPMPLALEWAEAHPEWNQKRFDGALLYSTLFDIVKSLADAGHSA